MGYGVMRARAASAPGRVLRCVTLESLSPYQCFPGPVEELARTRMCAASPAAGVCPGDSGAPVFVRRGEEDVLAGVVSSSLDALQCREGAAVLTRVTPFGHWIQQVLDRVSAER